MRRWGEVKGKGLGVPRVSVPRLRLPRSSIDQIIQFTQELSDPGKLVYLRVLCGLSVTCITTQQVSQDVHLIQMT